MNKEDYTQEEFLQKLESLFQESLVPTEEEEADLKNHFRLFVIEKEILNALNEEWIDAVENVDFDNPDEVQKSEYNAMHPIYMRTHALNLSALKYFGTDDFYTPYATIPFREYKEVIDVLKDSPESVTEGILWSGYSLIPKETAKVLYQKLLVPYYKMKGALIRRKENYEEEPYFPLLVHFDEEYFETEDWNEEQVESAIKKYQEIGVNEEDIEELINFTKETNGIGFGLAPGEVSVLRKLKNWRGKSR